MMIELPYPERKDDILRGTRKHHFSRSCSGVWQVAYCIVNDREKIQAAIIYGQAPYPSVSRAFCIRPEDIPKHMWVQRMWGAGISRTQLDHLIACSHKCLAARGIWWIHTLTNPHAYVIDGPMRLRSGGYTGATYHRNDYLYLGWAGRKALSGFLIDNRPVHKRQGKITLTLSNVHDHYPHARSIRPLHQQKKQRWAYIIASTPQERQQRLLLMKYRQQLYEPLRQPRLLAELFPPMSWYPQLQTT